MVFSVNTPPNQENLVHKHEKRSHKSAACLPKAAALQHVSLANVVVQKHNLPASAVHYSFASICIQADARSAYWIPSIGIKVSIFSQDTRDTHHFPFIILIFSSYRKGAGKLDFGTATLKNLRSYYSYAEYRTS